MNKSQIVEVEMESEILKGNPLGDPTHRRLFVYIPQDFKKGDAIPALLVLTGFGGTGAQQLSVDPFGEDLKSRMDRLIAEKKSKPALLVIPDCFNRMGGSQYINSSAIGRYEDYLIQEVIPWVNQNYAPKNWGVLGKSSGGYGAIVLAMLYPKIFRAFADHSGDANFELCYLPDFPGALDQYRKAGGVPQFLDKMWKDKNRKRKSYMKPLNILAMAAHYSPNPKSAHLGVDFPVDLQTGQFHPEVWAKWQAWDPVRMIPKYKSALSSLLFSYVDCGSSDEFGLHWGARAKVQALKSIGLNPFYEEFEDGHMSISYRYDESIPRLVEALSRG